LRAKLDNPEGKLRPGMFANVRLILSERARAMTIPEEALVPLGTDQYVFKVVEGKVQRVQVKIGLRRDAKVEVTEGLRPGDDVVTAGQLKIRDGAAVSANPPGAAAARPGSGS